VTRAAEVIAHLLPRRAAPLLERVTGLPHGWGLWLRGQAVRRGALGRDRTAAVVAWAVARGPAPSTGLLPALSRWQALRSLLYQHWDPPPREERGLRWFAGGVSFLMHLGFALLLVLAALVSYLPPVPQQDPTRTQVSFLGRGTPGENDGGSPAQEPAATTAAEENAASGSAATPPPTQTPPTTQTPASPVPPTESMRETQAEATAAAPPMPKPQPAEPAPPTPQPPEPAQQNVQVSQADEKPQQAFVLPPVTPPQLPQVQPRAREVTVPQREVTLVERPALSAPAVPQAALPQPTLRTPEIAVREREVPAPPEPLPQLRSPRPVAQREVQLRQPQPPRADLAQREIRMPEIAQPAPQPAAPTPAPAPAQPQPREVASAPAAAPPDASKQVSETPARAPAPAADARDTAATTPSAAATQRASPTSAAPAPTPGSWSSAQKADDWGLADRTAPNARASDGLFNADGSPRVTGQGDGKTQDKGPPGSQQAQALDADKAGQWLERPPAFTYEQSRFERYWVPNESLLQEWVRRNIREMEIPIPGTSKRIKCVVSVLQLGGGCGVYDPNMQEKPAQSRPPPEIPVKRNPIPVGS